MKATCNNCGKIFNIGDRKLPEGKSKFTCRQCQHPNYINSHAAQHDDDSISGVTERSKCDISSTRDYDRKYDTKEKNRSQNTSKLKRIKAAIDSIAIVLAASFSISVCAGYGGLSYLRGEYSATHTTKSYNTKTAPFLKSSRWLSYATLPSGTVGQWESAHIFNKKATAAGWALSVPKIQNHVRDSGSLDALKPFAEELTICVDEAAAGEQYWDTEIRELAVSCMVSMGWQHPDHEIME